MDNHLPLAGLSHLVLHVSDLDASASWYQSAVGLKLIGTQPGKSVVLQPPNGGLRVALTAGRPADAHGEFNHVAFAVHSLDVLNSWAEHLDEIGVAYKGVKEIPTGYTIDLVDPDGYEVELAYEP